MLNNILITVSKQNMYRNFKICIMQYTACHPLFKLSNITTKLPSAQATSIRHTQCLLGVLAHERNPKRHQTQTSPWLKAADNKMKMTLARTLITRWRGEKRRTVVAESKTTGQDKIVGIVGWAGENS